MPFNAVRDLVIGNPKVCPIEIERFNVAGLAPRGKLVQSFFQLIDPVFAQGPKIPDSQDHRFGLWVVNTEMMQEVMSTIAKNYLNDQWGNCPLNLLQPSGNHVAHNLVPFGNLANARGERRSA